MRASIIVPTLNRSALLCKTLSSIALQTFPADQFEIIVVDNGSIDCTREIVGALIKNNPCHQIRYVYEPASGLLAGRHRGARDAIGELLIFVDDDIEAVPGWLSAIVAGFDDAEVQLIGGRSLPKYEIEPPAWIESFWRTSSDGVRFCWYLSLLDLGQKKLPINPRYIFGLNFSIRRNAFYDLGGFHPDCISDNLQQFDGDGESGLTVPAEARGFVAIYEPAATVYHIIPASRMTLDYFERRAYLQGIRDSYSKVRRKGRPGIELWAKMRRVAGKAIRGAKQLDRSRIFVQSEERTIAAMHQRVADAYEAGFEFHQRTTRTDPNVLKWVLRPHYWDYRIPR